MKRRLDVAVRHAEIQASLGRAVQNLRVAREIAESYSQYGLGEDLFMIQTELERIWFSTRDERQLRRYDAHRQHVSQRRLEV